MKFFKFVLFSVLTLVTQGFANADLTVSITQVGPDVVVNSQGTVDTSSLNFIGGAPIGAFVRPYPDGTQFGRAGMIIGMPFPDFNFPTMDLYNFIGSAPPISFGPGTSVVVPDAGTGDAHGFFPYLGPVGDFVMDFWVPQGYQSGDPLQSEMIFANTTIAALGIDIGTFQWSAGGNNIDPLVSVQAPPGDLNQDGGVNFLDIAPFISILSLGGYLAEADIDQNGVVDFLDIQHFIILLSS